jgi:hypothetical protein
LKSTILFRQFFADVRREFVQHPSVVLHGTLASYLRDALHEGGAAAFTCLLAPRAHVHLPFSPPSLLVDSTAFIVIKIILFSKFKKITCISIYIGHK